MRSASFKTLFPLVSLAAAFGALAWSAERSGPELTVPPPVRAVDAPPSAAATAILRLELGLPEPGSRTAEVGTDSVCVPGPCKPVDLALLKAQLAAHADAIRPGTLSPRTVAELRGVGGLVAWRNRASKLCLVVQRQNGSESSIFGPCVGDQVQPCTAICLVSAGGSVGDEPVRYLLGGVVGSGATALRLTTAVSQTTYALTGPLLRGTDRRIVLLDLGRDDYRLLELLRGSTAIDRLTMPALQAAFEDCWRAHPAWKDAAACTKAAGSPGVPSARLP